MVAGREGARSHQFSDLTFPCLAVVTLWCVHFAFGNGYGFHRDELKFLYDARHLRLGYVAYPPITALVGRLGIALFGVSPSSLRLAAVLGNSVTVVLASLLSRRIGGNRFSQALTVLAVLPVVVVYSSVLQYNTFDLLAWTVMAYYTARVLASGEQKYWLGVGVGIGFGMTDAEHTNLFGINFGKVTNFVHGRKIIGGQSAYALVRNVRVATTLA